MLTYCIFGINSIGCKSNVAKAGNQTLRNSRVANRGRHKRYPYFGTEPGTRYPYFGTEPGTPVSEPWPVPGTPFLEPYPVPQFLN